MAVLIGVIMILASFKMCDGHGKYLSSVFGEVDRGNITHFSMSYQGTVLLELTSLSGDCDLYVSQHTIRPNYEPHSYCLQSMTCGVDTIIVPKSFKRPIGIGIFGYPTHSTCNYQLVFYAISDVLDVFNYDYFSDSSTSSKNEKLLGNDSENMLFPLEDVKLKAGQGEEGSISGAGVSLEGGTGGVGGGEKEAVKEVKEKRKTRKVGESDKDKNDEMGKRQRYQEGESYFLLVLDYLIECLIDIIL